MNTAFALDMHQESARRTHARSLADMAVQPRLRLLLLRPPPPPHRNAPRTPPSSPAFATTLRGAAAAALLLLAASPPPPRPARADPGGGEDIGEARVVRLFQAASPSVAFIKVRVVGRAPGLEGGQVQADDDEEVGATVEGTGSGFVRDTAGHIVTNYHVVAKLAGDGSAFHHCKVYLEDSSGTSYSNEVDVDGDKLRPALIGTSKGLRVWQSCFAIGNPYGYEHMLTTGVFNGLERRYHLLMGG